MSLFSLPTLLLLACTSTSYCERCGMLGDRLDLPRVRLVLVCYNTCINKCRVHALQEHLCSAHNPHWKSERATRKGCKKYSSSFYERKGYGIKGHNDKTLAVTVPTCKSLCIQEREFVCVSFDFFWRSVNEASCFLSSVGFMDVRGDEREYNTAHWSLFTRKCREY